MKAIDCLEKASSLQVLTIAHEVTTMNSRQRPLQRNVGIVSLFLLFTSALLFAGCGAQEDRVDEPVTIRYVAPGAESQSVPEEAAIERFHEHVPSIAVDRQTQMQGLSHYLSESPPPDAILWYEGYELYDTARQNLLFDLSEIWAENDLVEAYGRQFREIGRVNGTSRFIPAGFAWTGVYYNKDIFDRYGLVPPETWEEFISICDTLLANGETPLSLAGKDHFHSIIWFSYLNMRLNGPSFHRRLIEGEVSYNDERLVPVWETWLSLLQRGYFIESPGQTSETESVNALIRGDENNPTTQKKAVMALAAHYSVGGLSPEFADELDFFPFPLMNPDSAVGEISLAFGYVIPAGAVHKTEASTFVGYMVSAEAQAMQMVRIGEDPTNAGWIPLHREVDRTLLSVAARKGENIVRGADEVMPPLAFSLPSSMFSGFTTLLDWMFLKLETGNNEVDVSEIQSILEEARQQAFQNGEYRQ